MAIRIDGTEVRAFADQLRGTPKELRVTLRRAIREASEELVSDIKTNSSWSSRIPGAVKIRVGFGERSAGVLVYVDRRQAPHARPLEFGSQGSRTVNRHPVFGNAENWVSQPTRPFFMKSIDMNERQVVDKVQSAIDGALSRL